MKTKHRDRALFAAFIAMAAVPFALALGNQTERDAYAARTAGSSSASGSSSYHWQPRPPTSTSGSSSYRPPPPPPPSGSASSHFKK